MVNATLVRVLARSQASRGRVGIGLLAGGVLVLIAGLANFGSPTPRIVATLIANSAFSFLVPVVALLFAVACLGDLVEDRTLVYVWLRPVSRLTLATSAVVATTITAGSLVVGSLLVAAVVGGRPTLLVPGIVAGTLGVAAYGAVFVALGFRSTRSLLWGLAYSILWEGIASNLTLAFARFSLRRYAASIYADLGNVGEVLHPTRAWHGIVVLLAVTAAGTAFTTWLLTHADID